MYFYKSFFKNAKAQLTYIGSSYSLTNTNTDWNAKFTKGVINMGNPNSWQSFFQSPASYSPGTTETIRWNANSLPGGSTLSLEYTIDNGTTWIPIAAGITGATTRFNWMVPSTVTSQARIRVSQTWPFGISDMSDTVFAILGQPQGLAASTCENRVTLNWTTVTNASSYNIFKLDETTDAWALLGISTTNSFTTTENILACYYYTVEAVNTTTNTTSEKAIAIRLCLTANATLAGSMAITRSPNGCMSVGTTNIYLTSNTSIPAGSTVRWEISSDNGASWVSTTLTQTGSSQWVIPYLQPYMGGWQYRLTYIDYTSCTKIVGNIIILDLDFDFTSYTDVDLTIYGNNTLGTHTVTLDQSSGVLFQWQFRYYKQEVVFYVDPITGTIYYVHDYFPWEDIKPVTFLDYNVNTETHKQINYSSLGVWGGNIRFKFINYNTSSLTHQYVVAPLGPGPFTNDELATSLWHQIRCKAYNASCIKYSNEGGLGLHKTGNTSTGLDNSASTHNFEIYPNPVIDKELTFKINNNLQALLTIYSVEGKEMHSASFINDYKLNVSDWANGCYFIKFLSGSTISTKKLVINHK